MLLRGCNCPSHPASFSRRKLLCAGGAGFVSALIATLVGEARVAQAEPLGRAVPEVDRLAVRMVTDNIVMRFIPTEQRKDVLIERIPGNIIFRDALPTAALNGEFGLSMHAETQRGTETRNILVDFGYTPEVLLNNMSILKIDPANFDALVLSHGHYDHFGGLTGFLSSNKGRLKRDLPFFVGSEDCFCTRESLDGNQFGSLDRKAVMDAGLSLAMASGPAVVADHAFTAGKIALSSFEKPLQTTIEKTGVIDGFGCFPDKMPAAKNTGVSSRMISSTKSEPTSWSKAEDWSC